MSQQMTSLDNSRPLRDLAANLASAQAVLETFAAHTLDTVLLVDAAGRILSTNRDRAAFAPDEVVGSSSFDLLAEPNDNRYREALRNACELGQAERCELRWRDGSWGVACVAPVLGQMTPTAIVIVTDVTRLKKTEESLRESEQRFLQLAENVREVFWLMDVKDKRVLYASNAYERIWGRPVKWLYEEPRSWLNSIHPDDRDRVERAFSGCAKSGGFRAEYRIVRPDGTQRWIRDRGFVARDADGQAGRIAGVAQDVTEQKSVEDKLRLERKLLKRLLDLQERERRLLAYELHDGLIQDLVGAKMLIESLVPALGSAQPALKEQLSIVESVLRQAIGEGRRMISNLRPMVIDESGILAAIDYLISEASGADSPKMAFRHNVRFSRLSPLLEGALFRIVQESLTNARRHSHATHVDVELAQVDDRVVLTVRDDGVGFDSATVPKDRFGLSGLMERTRLFGGRSHIRSELGKGTEIWVELPISTSGISDDASRA
jgi:PAS domain S-box-containing protein